MSVFASDRPTGERSKVIATTGRIVKINTKDKTLTVSGAASAAGTTMLPRQRPWHFEFKYRGS